MTSWEERMSIKAKACMFVEEAERIAREAAEEAERDRLDEEACRPAFEAGPPCSECYVWSRKFPILWTPTEPAWHWAHRTVETGDETCYHECHDEPVWCGQIAMA